MAQRLAIACATANLFSQTIMFFLPRLRPAARRACIGLASWKPGQDPVSPFFTSVYPFSTHYPDARLPVR
jgi:hypothetical protein